MRLSCCCVRVMVLVLLLSVTITAAPPEPTRPPTRDPQGYFLSDGLLNAVMKRWAFELSNEIDLTPDEETEVFQALSERWVPFIQNNQERFAPLVEGYLQAMADPDPPSPETVKKWAESASDLHEMIFEQINETEKEVSDILPEEKVGRFRGEFTKMRMGMGYMASRYEVWKKGEFDGSHWERGARRRANRRARHLEERARDKETEFARLVSISSWDAYVREFIDKFQLDGAQRTSANAVLTDVKGRAKSYLDAHQHDIEDTTAKLQSSTPLESEDRLAMLEKKEQLVQPLEDLFSELQTRLDKIPTQAQRSGAEASQSEPAAEDN